MLLQKNIVKKYLALLPDEQTQEAWKWVREPSLDPRLLSVTMGSGEFVTVTKYPDPAVTLSKYLIMAVPIIATNVKVPLHNQNIYPINL